MDKTEMRDCQAVYAAAVLAARQRHRFARSRAPWRAGWRIWPTSLALCLCCDVVAAGSSDALTLYAGRYTDSPLPEEILPSKPLVLWNSWILAAAHSRTIGTTRPRWHWEREFQLVKHFGAQSHWEANGLLIWRWDAFWWDDFIDTSIAVGDGLSYASDVPRLERRSHNNEGAQQWLNYVLLETTLKPRGAANWHLVIRIHHRSGVFGVFNGVHGGSNVIAAGLRLDLGD